MFVCSHLCVGRKIHIWLYKYRIFRREQEASGFASSMVIWVARGAELHLVHILIFTLKILNYHLSVLTKTFLI